MNTDLIGHLILYYALITTIMAVIYRKKYFNSKMKFFFYMLLSLGFVDVVGKYFANSNWTAVVYNLGLIFHILGFIFLYYLIVNDKKIKTSYRYIGITFFICCVINFIFFNSIKNFSTFNFFTGSWSLVAVIILFFRKIINTDKVLHLKKFLWFWVSVGLFILYVGGIPVLSAVPLKLDVFQDKVDLLLYFLNFVMYTCFNIGLIWSQKEHNHLSL